MHADVLVVGGGTGGVAAALGALRAGRSVILTEEYDWLGGQLTSQAVPPDEHTWIEQFGATASYRRLRDGIRDYYRRSYPLTAEARARRDLNPGAGWVSRLCHEPRVAVAVIDELLAPYRGSGRLRVLQPYRPVAAECDGDRVTSVTLSHRDSGETLVATAPYILDATETGELLPLTGTEYVTGFEAQSDTGEPSAPDTAQPLNMQAVSYCFALDHVDGDHTIDRPESYDFWRAYQPPFWGAPLLSFTAPHPRTLETVTRGFTPNPGDDPAEVIADQRVSGGDMNLWTFRRIAARDNFTPGTYDSDITLVNWPMIDYLEGPVIDVPDAAAHLASAKQLSLSYLYWLQTEAPRPDGGTGFPGLRLRHDVTGSADGLAQAPYIRESRRILADYTVVEQDLSLDARGGKGAANYPDSVGIGMYRIDLHPSTGGDNYIDVPSSPFEIPLGALLPRRVENLLPAGKNIGTTHITNGCYRLHPVEWNIGEVAGLLAAHCVEQQLTPRAVRDTPEHLETFQRLLTAHGVELRWPDISGY
ncbi:MULTISPECIES: FAD-dependent oxidoreductase [Streptomyces]|nr:MULTISPECIES: FAD-dependent oxidoreductase [Streptomyces]ALC26192.1 FAD-dependent oxidoreductase [Streptomyces sp. CFMR 7]MBT3073253.1 FAD-dependent oxidoreductase [Streptomyces sp. COG21]MBT3081655.1 FAD-dependent oxidoreductase [Streptomyces sp. COG20]MBT3085173.1 FAD-dependent oxidoreductase [Streptomyces sp. CYG21]MBT3100426.1 FAD-dependent oxidoreductase [Streptomyces sp. CBG30]